MKSSHRNASQQKTNRRDEMTERPINCNAREVRALLDGSMTQKRWVAELTDAAHVKEPRGHRRWHPADPAASLACPYGQPGDRLWVRESIDGIWGCDAHYMADEAHLSNYIKDWWNTPQRLACKKTPPSHMPRWASRITLDIVGVRVERLQDISHQDAIAEGGVEVAGGWWSHDGTIMDTPGDTHFGGTAVDSYRVLWESINGSGSWDANPWVWVVEFKTKGTV